jgi:hypothetical protein
MIAGRIHHNISNLSLYVAGVFFCIFFKLIKVVDDGFLIWAD